MPCTPMAESASRTSSSLNGLMMAVTSFMWVSPRFADSEGPGDESDQSLLAPVLALVGIERFLGIGALEVAADGPAVAEVVDRARLPHHVRERVVVLEFLVTQVA